MTTTKSVYLASSWRNPYQEEVWELLTRYGHKVYDFKHPAPGNNGFHWKEIDPKWETWDVADFRTALWSPVAEEHFKCDMEALIAADLVVLLLPSGRSAHTEAAWACGNGRPVIVHCPEACWLYHPEEVQPELMYKMFNAITTTDHELIGALTPHLSQIHSHRLFAMPLPEIIGPAWKV